MMNAKHSLHGVPLGSAWVESGPTLYRECIFFIVLFFYSLLLTEIFRFPDLFVCLFYNNLFTSNFPHSNILSKCQVDASYKATQLGLFFME